MVSLQSSFCWAYKTSKLPFIEDLDKCVIGILSIQRGKSISRSYVVVVYTLMGNKRAKEVGKCMKVTYTNTEANVKERQDVVLIAIFFSPCATLMAVPSSV